MEKVRIGVLGGYRGTGAINYCRAAQNAEVVAICDKSVEVIEKQKELCKGENITFYTDFDQFIQHDMDAVVLANYANEHAPFAIRCLKAGLHVYSEVLPCQTMKEAVELIEAVEESGKIYDYAENYCYMIAAYEMRKLYREGRIGELEYAQSEYMHNCAPVWQALTYGDKNHWRNNMYSTFYCTHSIGPIIHMTGLRPVAVNGFEFLNSPRHLNVGCKGGVFGIEMIELENGGILRSVHGSVYVHSIAYNIDGSKGRLAMPRYIPGEPHPPEEVYVAWDEYEGKNDIREECYKPDSEIYREAAGYGHSGGDYLCMWNFVEKIRGNKDADIIDVYEAMDMFLPGLFAYRSILNGNARMEIPDLRDKAQRDQFRNDTACTDPNVAGDMLLPTTGKGTPDIPDEVYTQVYKKWRAEVESNTGFAQAMYAQSSKETIEKAKNGAAPKSNDQ